MPCKDPEYQKELKRVRFHERYHEEKGFKEREKKRKAEWYQKNRERLIAKAQDRVAALKKAAEKARRTRKKAA